MCFPGALNSFPVTALAKGHRLGGLNQLAFIYSLPVLEVRNAEWSHWATQSRCQAHSPCRLQGENPLPLILGGVGGQVLSGLCLRETPVKNGATRQEWSIGVIRFLFGKRKKSFLRLLDRVREKNADSFSCDCAQHRGFCCVPRTNRKDPLPRVHAACAPCPPAGPPLSTRPQLCSPGRGERGLVGVQPPECSSCR